MPVNVSCPFCGQSQSVPQNSLGQVLRCSKCRQSFETQAPFSQQVVPRAVSFPQAGVPVARVATPVQPFGGATPTSVWYLRTPDGQSFGPVGKMELDSWVAEGAVPGNSMILQQGTQKWQEAWQVYPILANQSTGNEFAINVGGNSGSGYGASTFGGYGSSSTSKVKQPHRGSLILTLALVGWFIFPILCIAAWVMAANDLKQMRMGRMDRSGEGMTFFGMVMGIIGTVLMILWAMLVIAVIAGAFQFNMRR